jgi:hypothetical protein
MSEPRLLSTADVAKRLGRSRRWMQDFELAKRFGRILGNRRVYTEEDFKRLVDALPRPEPHRALRDVYPPRKASRARSSVMDEALRLARGEVAGRRRRRGS